MIDGNSNERLLPEELLGVVYNDLRRLARNYLRHERPNHTLQPTALVHEAYLRVTEQVHIKWQGREHFIGVAATMMRRILINHAVKRKCEKRGGNDITISSELIDQPSEPKSITFIELDQALGRLAQDRPQEAQIVELKFFGGLTIAEIASVLEISESTVERNWRFAKTWLHSEINRGR